MHHPTASYADQAPISFPKRFSTAFLILFGFECFEDFKYSDKFNDDGTAKTSESDNQTNEAEEVSAPVEYTPLSYQPASNSIQFDPKSRPDNCF